MPRRRPITVRSIDRVADGRVREQLEDHVAPDADDPRRRDGTDRGDPRLRLEDRHLADDLAGSQERDRDVGRPRPLHDLQLARHDHEERVAGLALARPAPRRRRAPPPRRRRRSTRDPPRTARRTAGRGAAARGRSRRRSIGIGSQVGEVLVDEPDRHRALADGRRDPLDRVRPDVAGAEDPRDVRLEQERLAGQPPARGDARRRARDRHP